MSQVEVQKLSTDAMQTNTVNNQLIPCLSRKNKQLLPTLESTKMNFDPIKMSSIEENAHLTTIIAGLSHQLLKLVRHGNLHIRTHTHTRTHRMSRQRQRQTLPGKTFCLQNVEIAIKEGKRQFLTSTSNGRLLILLYKTIQFKNRADQHINTQDTCP